MEDDEPMNPEGSAEQPEGALATPPSEDAPLHAESERAAGEEYEAAAAEGSAAILEGGGEGELSAAGGGEDGAMEGAEGATEATPEEDPAPMKRSRARPEEPPLTEEELALLEEPEDDGPLPELYRVLEDGTKVPHEGVESIFCTGTTLDIVGLKDLGQGEPMLLLKAVAKDVILHDINFRAAISDFSVIKHKMNECDYDPVLIAYNDEDYYGDGNNIMVATKKAAADIWLSIDALKEKRRKVAEARERARRIEKRKPKSKQQRLSKPWVDLGSAVEVEQLQVRSARPKLQCMAERKRALFNREYTFSDRESHDLWNSSMMESRPFKDPNFDLRRVEMDVEVQAVPEIVGAGVQASALPPRNQGLQWAARDLDRSTKEALLQSRDLAQFMANALPVIERALQQNEVVNIFQDEIAALFDEDAASGAKTDNAITEYQSFTDLVYSKSKNVWAIEWVPGRRGLVAVSCTEALSFDQRVEEAGKPSTSAVLIWNFSDPIHPEKVLESPFEIFSFSFNPMHADIVAGGCLNGQVILWDLRQIDAKGGESKGGGGDGSSQGTAKVPVVRHVMLSDVDASHSKCIMGLEWLPNIEILRDYRVQQLDSGKECNFFATTATDGHVLFWDCRLENIQKPRGRREADGPLWIPIMRIVVQSEVGGALSCTRFNFSNRERPLSTKYFIGSNEGEVVFAEFGAAEKGGSADTIHFHSSAHTSTIVALSRCPAFPNLVMSAGDWSFQVFKEGFPHPIFTSPMAPTHYTGGAWSPSRPGVLYLARVDGVLEVWDLVERSHEPALTTTVSSTALRSIAFQTHVTSYNQHMAHHFLAIGDDTGVLHVLELPRNLRRPSQSEKKSMEAFWQREQARMLAATGNVRDGHFSGAGLEGDAPAVATPAAAEASSLPRTTTAPGASRLGSAGGSASALGSRAGTADSGAVQVDERMEKEYRKLLNAVMVQLELIKPPEKSVD